jgi:hypothetical protein
MTTVTGPVRNLVEYAQRRKKTSGEIDFDNNVPQTKGLLQGTALSLRLDLALLADLLTLKRRNCGNSQATVELQLDKTKEDCYLLINVAEICNRPP